MLDKITTATAHTGLASAVTYPKLGALVYYIVKCFYVFSLAVNFKIKFQSVSYNIRS